MMSFLSGLMKIQELWQFATEQNFHPIREVSNLMLENWFVN